MFLLYHIPQNLTTSLFLFLPFHLFCAFSYALSFFLLSISGFHKRFLKFSLIRCEPMPFPLFSAPQNMRFAPIHFQTEESLFVSFSQNQLALDRHSCYPNNRIWKDSTNASERLCAFLLMHLTPPHGDSNQVVYDFGFTSKRCISLPLTGTVTF